MSNERVNLNSVNNLWKAFLDANPSYRVKDFSASFYFCDNEKDANECAELVVNGVKQATATSLWWFETNGEHLPEVGNLYIVTDWNGIAKAIIETFKVDLEAFCNVSAEFAAIEGEGDGSLTYWREVHEAYYKREMEPFGAIFSEDMIIVCEYFKRVF